MPDDAEMPRYKCHKEVWALKIVAFEPNLQDGSARIVPADPGYGVFTTGPGWTAKFHGQEAPDGGYYVRYADGYESWSPTKAFEEGYTPL